jgi:hypothetical protein
MPVFYEVDDATRRLYSSLPTFLTREQLLSLFDTDDLEPEEVTLLEAFTGCGFDWQQHVWMKGSERATAEGASETLAIRDMLIARTVYPF